MRADGRLLAGVFCVCFANLLLEVVITRLFSATMFYHFTFLAIALALFGVAASGVYVFIAGEILARDVRSHMARASRRFAIFAVIALAYAMANPMDIIIVTGSNAIPEFTSRQMWQLIFLVGITSIPFFYSGMVVSLALTYFRSDTGRVYAWDLGGAAAAALTTGLVLGIFGGPTAVLVAMVVSLVGAALFDATGWSRWAYVAAGVLFVVCNLGSPIIRVPTAKGVKVETRPVRGVELVLARHRRRHAHDQDRCECRDAHRGPPEARAGRAGDGDVGARALDARRRRPTRSWSSAPVAVAMCCTRSSPVRARSPASRSTA